MTVVLGLSVDEPRAPCASRARSQGVRWVCVLTSIIYRDAAPCYPSSQTVAFYVMLQTEKRSTAWTVWLSYLGGANISSGTIFTLVAVCIPSESRSQVCCFPETEIIAFKCK